MNSWLAVMCFAFVILSCNTPAGAHGKHKHVDGAKAHAHGAGKMDIAFDGLKGEIDFEVSAEAILGTENAPKGDKAIAEEKERLKIFAGKFQEGIEFQGTQCKWGEVKSEINRRKVGQVQHADITVEASINCETTIHGQNLRIELAKFYPGLLKIAVQINATDFQKGAEITPKTTTIELK